MRDAIAGLDALLGMQQGSISLAAGNWTLTGNVAGAAERHTIETRLAAVTDTSGWHVAIQAADAAPVVSPFTWSASKSAEGAYTLKGYVPTDELRNTIAVRAGTVAADSTLVGSGEPDGFAADAVAGLDALAKLQSGQVGFDGQAWSISGQPLTTADAEAAKAALNSTGRAVAWTVAFAEPPQAPPAVESAAELAAPEPLVTPVDENRSGGTRGCRGDSRG